MSALLQPHFAGDTTLHKYCLQTMSIFFYSIQPVFYFHQFYSMLMKFLMIFFFVFFFLRILCFILFHIFFLFVCSMLTAQYFIVFFSSLNLYKSLKCKYDVRTVQIKKKTNVIQQ